MTEWKTYKLGDVATITTGFPFKGDLYSKNGIRVLRGENIGDEELRWDGHRDKRWNLPFERINEYSLQDGDVILAMDGNVGKNKARITDEDLPMLIAQRVACIRANTLSDQKFLYYAIISRAFQQYLDSVKTGTTIQHISMKQIADYEISLPGLEEQRRIAGILGAIDDKIENNRRINTNLELQAQALYKQWFVDNSTVKLGDVVKTSSGGTPSRSHMEFYVGKYGWVKSKELNSSFITKTEETITDDAIAKSAAKLLPAKSILIAMYGATVGQYAILSQPMTCNQAVCALLPNENYPYTYLFMVAKNIKEELANKAIGSAQQNISQVIIKDIDISSDIEKIKQFHKIVYPHFEVMEKNQKENETLATLRDTLLSKLVSGEIKL